MLREARITNVKNEDGIILLSVEFNDGSVRKNVAYGKLSSDIILSPREGDVVAVQETKSGRHVATTVISKTERESPDVSQGEVAFQLDEDNSLKFTDTENGFKLTIDLTDDIIIESSGKVQIDAAEDVLIGENGVPVAKQDHTHNFDYSWTDEGGSDSGTTNKPNETGTETKIK